MEPWKWGYISKSIFYVQCTSSSKNLIFKKKLILDLMKREADIAEKVNIKAK